MKPEHKPNHLSETTITIKIQTTGMQAADINIATIEGAFIDFIDSNETLDTGLRYPGQRTFTIDIAAKALKAHLDKAYDR